MRGPGDPINLQANRDSAHRFAWSVPAAVTAGWAPGRYSYVVRATEGETTLDVEAGDIVIAPDLVAAGAGYDARSQNRIALESIDAVIAKRATVDQSRYRINNRELWRMSPAELFQLRAHFLREVRKEDAAASGRPLFGHQVTFRMGRIR